MTDLAPVLTKFLTVYLQQDRGFSALTVDSYTDSFRLLVVFAEERLNIQPCQLQIEQLDVALILDFLDHLERERNSSARTRNVRLAAIKSFFRYVQYQKPACLELCRQVQAIPMKRSDDTLIEHLEPAELKALLNAPDISTPSGIRDQAMLYITYACGLRVSELTGLQLQHLSLPGLESVHILGKGRTERVLPLWQETRKVIRAWLAVRPDNGDPHLFFNARNRPISRHGVAQRLKVHVKTAAREMPSIANKRVTPHVLRHTVAMDTLAATGDSRKVSEWLGHRSMSSTECYLRKDPAKKLQMLGVWRPVPIEKGKFEGSKDQLMAMLNAA